MKALTYTAFGCGSLLHDGHVEDQKQDINTRLIRIFGKYVVMEHDRLMVLDQDLIK
jgi:hypothetical protein